MPLQSQGWHELPNTSGFPKKPGAHLGEGGVGDLCLRPCSVLQGPTHTSRWH